MHFTIKSGARLVTHIGMVMVQDEVKKAHFVMTMAGK